MQDENIFDQSNSLDVWVIQDSKRLENRLFLSALAILIIIANMLMGCEVIVFALRIVYVEIFLNKKNFPK